MIINAVSRRAAAEVNPADIGGIQVTEADVFTDHRTVVGVGHPIHPAEVGGVGVAVGGEINRRGGMASHC